MLKEWRMVMRQVLVICLLNCTREVGWVVACSGTYSDSLPDTLPTGHSFGFINYSFRTDVSLSVKPLHQLHPSTALIV